MDLTSIDIHDPDIYVQGVPHDAFRYLRREQPVFWQDLPEGRGYWALLKHADVMAASSDPATFSAARRGIVIEDPHPEHMAMLRTQLLSMDPPEHTAMRRHVLAFFTPGFIAGMEPWLRERTRALFDEVADRGSCEFVMDVAAQLPVQVVSQMMGIPEEDRAQVITWGDQLIGRDDPDLAVPDEEVHSAAVALGTYGFGLAQRRKGSGGGDLTSLLLDAEVDGHKVDEAGFAGLFVQLVVAGNETTRTLLAGGFLALLEHRDAWRALAANPSGIPTAVEEMLRWVTPVHYFRRTATRDVELQGQKIREGDRVVLLYSSANRDEDVFDEPDRFDIRRDPNPHLAFGWAEHFCLGARLARLEARVFWEEFFARFSDAELVGAPRRMRSNLNNAYKEIPVRLTPC